jgi:SpoVK/Ycf46/Vps4 family AAA+-type ATPase
MSKINPYISSRFERVIKLHVIKNLVTGFPVPLILGIHGPSGCGKTYQCEYLLRELGAKSFLISGGQLESGTAGEPAKLIRESYIAASESIQKGDSKVAVILINDVDTGLGNWGGNVQTTINTQTVYGELMHLVDYPTSVEGRLTMRIPIILTGNDFTKLYEPLVRAGRMTAFEWNPNLEEKIEIISGIFPDLEKKQCSQLAQEFQNQSVAFFSHLNSILKDDILWRSIQRIGACKVIDG